ncbi:MAG TPA: acyl-CoA reductase [Rhodothermales bacterium]|nr:acyl-CoA reductase [Rhodothermales bacterium]
MIEPFDSERRAQALENAAGAWLRRECLEATSAIRQTLEAPNWFTPPALSVAVDRAMARVTAESLRSWAERSGRFGNSTVLKVAVLNAGNVPLVGLQDFLAVLLAGHDYLGIVSRSSPYLLPAFAETVRRYDSSIGCRFVTLDEAVLRADALIATGSSATSQLIWKRFAAAGMPRHRALLRGSRTGAAVLYGSESDADLFSLASDVLLHEGRGCRSVAIVMAPAELEPDRFVEQANRFRRDFPPHAGTLLGVGRAVRLLNAVEEPFIHGDGFVLIEGDVALLEPCIVRWIRYNDESEPASWLKRNRRLVQVVVSSGSATHIIPEGIDGCRFGEGQDPPLSWCPDGVDTVAFLNDFTGVEL